MRNLNIIECEQVAGAAIYAGNSETGSVMCLGLISGIPISYYASLTFQMSLINTIAFSALGGILGTLALPVFLYGLGKATAYTYHAGFSN